MRLRLLTVMGALALALAVPSAALAHHGRGHHHNHKAHHAKFRFEHIGPTGVSGPTTTPSDPAPPSSGTPPPSAGKIASFEKEVLTITLNDNSTVSGKVTSDTRIECVSATPPPTTEPGDQNQGDDDGEGDDQNRGDTSQSGEGWGDHKDGGDDDGEGAGPEPPCDTSLLTPGREVRSAELRIGPSGTEFESIVLVR